MSELVITDAIFRGMAKIKESGMALRVDTEQRGGHSHTVTYIDIGMRSKNSFAVSKWLRVKHTSSYAGQFSDWSGVSPEFGALGYSQLNAVDELVTHALKLQSELLM